MSESDNKPSLKQRWKDTMERYGTLAITIYLSTFVIAMTGFTIAIKAGFEVDSGAEKTGTLLMAYGATQLTKPIRLIATIVLVPLVDQALKRRAS